MCDQRNNQAAYAASRAARKFADNSHTTGFSKYAAIDASEAAKSSAIAGVHQVCDSYKTSAEFATLAVRTIVNTFITQDAVPMEFLNNPTDAPSATNDARAIAWKALDPVGLLEKLVMA